MYVLKSSLIVTILFYSIISFGQNDFVNYATNLFTKETIFEAEIEVNTYLESHQHNANALMLKGNMLYYKYIFSQPEINKSIVFNEDVYASNFSDSSASILQLPKEIADSISNYLLRAVQIEENRLDIHFGICYIYSLANEIEKLNNYLPIIYQKAINSDEDVSDLPYLLEEYGLNLITRNHFEGGIIVFEAIRNLFPNDAGIISDEAAQYFAKGLIDTACLLLKEAESKENLDVITWGNAFYIYGITEQYDLALNAYQHQCTFNANNDYLVYKAMLELVNSKTTYVKTLNNYLHSNPDNVQFVNLANYITSNKFLNTYEDFVYLQSFGIGDVILIMLNKYYYQRFPDMYLTAFNYAEILNYHKQYEKAANIYRKISKQNLSKKALEDLTFYSAWAYYKNSEIEKSIPLWQTLLGAQNFYFVSGAAYFLGNYYMSQQKLEIADAYFKRVADKQNLNKYAKASNMALY